MEEVVRCGKRVVGAARSFSKEILSNVRCHHGGGPPLESFLYVDDTDGDDVARFELCAAKTLNAFGRNVKLSNLSLNNRLAVIVPDASFRQGLTKGTWRASLRVFREPLAAGLNYRKPRLYCQRRSVFKVGQEQIVMDEVSQLDGMEFLIVICVCLDTPQENGPTSAATESRSRLYRGVTRAHAGAGSQHVRPEQLARISPPSGSRKTNNLIQKKWLACLKSRGQAGCREQATARDPSYGCDVVEARSLQSELVATSLRLSTRSFSLQ